MRHGRIPTEVYEKGYIEPRGEPTLILDDKHENIIGVRISGSYSEFENSEMARTDVLPNSRGEAQIEFYTKAVAKAPEQDPSTMWIGYKETDFKRTTTTTSKKGIIGFRKDVTITSTTLVPKQESNWVWDVPTP